MKIVAVIQARTGSTRLPRKVLADVAGKTLLERVVERVGRAHSLNLVVVATTVSSADDELAELCARTNTLCYRGNEHDVLDRYYEAARKFEAQVIVRVTADCPLIDPIVIDQVVHAFQEGGFEYVSNTIERTFPDGLDVEVFSWCALDRAWREAHLCSEREHVTPYIWKNPALFRLRSVTHSPPLGELRWTIDQAEDLEFIREVYSLLGEDKSLGMEAVLSLLQRHPALNGINCNIASNEGYMKSLHDDDILKEKDTSMGTGQILYGRAKQVIPGGTQLLSKRPEMFLPDLWPSYYCKAQGPEVWDLDGNKYVDMSYNGIGTCILGAADPEVNAAVVQAVENGVMSTLNAPEEVELAELLCAIHPWAGMARYTRSGGEATSMAVRIARAKTRRDEVIVCGYHGWHDWYLSANLAHDEALDGHLLSGLEPAGVPRALLGLTHTFRYNCLHELKAIAAEHGTKIAAIIMEPMRDNVPQAGFLEGVRAIATSLGAILIFDEITSGFRLNTGGVHKLFGVEPDIAVFAKGISNGFAMGAVLGRNEVMQAAQGSFISSTYWTERIGPVAALATIKKHQRCEVHKHLIRIGKAVQNGWKAAALKVELSLEVGGMEPLSHFSFIGAHKQEARTLFTQMMLEKGFLAGAAFYVTYSHQDHHVEAYLRAVDEVFPIIANAISTNKLGSLLKGPVAHAGFQRLT